MVSPALESEVEGRYILTDSRANVVSTHPVCCIGTGTSALPICRPTTCDFVGLMKILCWWGVWDEKSLQSSFISRSVGLMDKVSAPGAGDSRFESWAGQNFGGLHGLSKALVRERQSTLHELCWQLSNFLITLKAEH